MKKTITAFIACLISLVSFSQKKVTISIGYIESDDQFLYSIPLPEENAKFGGVYYVKIANTGTQILNNWELTGTWKACFEGSWTVNSVVNSTTGAVSIKGPNGAADLGIGQNIILQTKGWIPSGSVEDWIDFLPRDLVMKSGGVAVEIVKDELGTSMINLPRQNLPNKDYVVQKVKQISESRKTNAAQKIVAYFPIFDINNAWCSLQKYGKNIDELRVQLYSITTDGKLKAGEGTPAGVDPVANKDYWYNKLKDVGVIDYCTNNQIELVPVVFNYSESLGDFDQQSVHNMMVNSTKKAQHIAEIKQILIDHPNLAGIDVDYESLLAADRDNYSQFMEELSTAVHSVPGKILTTAVHTKVGYGTWDGPQAQDFERIGNAVDEMTLMTYDLHWATSPKYPNPPPTAGCQATPDWINDVAFFAVSEVVNPAKIQIGLPFYGYRWKTGFESHTLQDPGKGLTYQDAMLLMQYTGVPVGAAQRENNGKELRFETTINGTSWTCYYQDSISIAHKLSSLKENDLKGYIGGVGAWRLGGESDAIWRSLVYHTKGTNAVITENNCVYQGVNEEILPEFEIFPNPSSSVVFIKSSVDVKEVLVYDLEGKLVFQKSNLQESIDNVDISKLTNGYYQMHIVSDFGVSIKPVVKLN